MAQMTRAQFELELQARGWNRYDEAFLDRYLDFALQDIYRECRFPTVQDQIFTGVLAANAQSVTMATIAGAAGTVGTIEGYWLERGNTQSFAVRAAKDWEWEQLIQPNIQLVGTSNEVKGSPRMYYPHGDTIWVYPTPDAAHDQRILWTRDEVIFANDGDVSGLPERFDSLILLAAEVHCNRRARDYESMAICQQMLNDALLKELARQSQRFQQEPGRVERYDHGVLAY